MTETCFECERLREEIRLYNERLDRDHARIVERTVRAEAAETRLAAALKELRETCELVTRLLLQPGTCDICDAKQCPAHPGWKAA